MSRWSAETFAPQLKRAGNPLSLFIIVLRYDFCTTFERR
jgi:hypothetical protein